MEQTPISAKKEQESPSAAHELFIQWRKQRARERVVSASDNFCQSKMPILQGKDLSMWPEEKDAVAMTSVHLGSAKDPWPWSQSQLCHVLFETPPVEATKAGVSRWRGNSENKRPGAQQKQPGYKFWLDMQM